MIKIDTKNRWSINIGLHIPIPSISLEVISDTEEVEVKNVPLQFDKEKEEAYEARNRKKNDSTDKGQDSQPSSADDAGHLAS